uniref:Uncharacterized protein n=1 Tax=uncultured marine thaumarchaeote KM3_41_D11 TaxID=1456145 RepID=A0A075H1B9_9ARCH|nr:hypothetical protein [uncultured marine thaumarchaeote KM3_41_D11]
MRTKVVGGPAVTRITKSLGAAASMRNFAPSAKSSAVLAVMVDARPAPFAQWNYPHKNHHQS